MPAAWRLAINSLSGRRNRTLLLVAAVALSSALIAAVSSAIASLDAAILQRAKAMLGNADVRIHQASGGTFADSAAAIAAKWPEVALVVPRFRDSLALSHQKAGKEDALLVYGIDPALEPKVRALDLVSGRLVQADDEILLDEHAADTLKATTGDVLEVVRFGDPVTLKVVGVVKPPPLGAIVQREETFMTLRSLQELSGKPGRLTEVDVILKPGSDANKVAAKRRTAVIGPGAGAAKTILQKFEQAGGAAVPVTPEATSDPLPPGLLVQATEKITSGIQKNMESNKIGLLLASVLAFIAASFIIMTGLTTAVGERIRELAILRCVGAYRSQLAQAQILVGGLVGLAGAAIGAPLGVFCAYILVILFPDQLPGGFALSRFGVVLSISASVAAGLAGAIWPAVQAASTSPLSGLTLRSRSTKPIWLIACSLAGPLLALVHVATLKLPPTADAVFWTYITLGLPCLMTGYFLLSVPVTMVVTRLAAGGVTKLLGLPPRLLGRTVSATPYRHGFTSGAMMLGLALLVAIWTNGSAVMRDWLDALSLPDAFLYGTDLKPQARDRVAAVPEVDVTCAITRMTVNLDLDKRTGVSGLGKFNTYFFGFEPKPFFKMTKVVWEEGDPDNALKRLEQGGVVLVERSFKVSRGIGVGQTINIQHNGRTYPFEVVGVISSPGLDIASKFMEVGEQFIENAVNSVFGSRDDMKKLFDNEAVNFIQMTFKPGADPATGLKNARSAAGQGVVLAVQASEMKDRVREVVGSTLMVVSLVAIGAMLISCFGVANLIIAGIQSRQFEFGVLRAVGAQRSLLGRLVMGEAILIALSACVLGTAMGLQGAWGGMQIYKILLGLVLNFSVAPWPIVFGCVAVTLITLGAAWPAVWQLMRRHPRELLAGMRG